LNNLTKDNVVLFAARVYDNPGCVSLEEFDSDYSKVRFIKVLLNKHINNKRVNVRLIINHLICMRNVFPGDATARILFTELDPSTWGILATFLSYLNMMPDAPFKINEVVYSADGFTIDENLLHVLEEL
jgi:hypothetical protein